MEYFVLKQMIIIEKIIEKKVKLSSDEKAEPSNFIDLTTLDSDEEIAIPMPKVDPSEVVCFGTITSGFSSVQHSILHNCLGNASSIEISVFAEPTGNPAMYGTISSYNL